MLTSCYNNGVSETRAYNNDNTLASISFSGAPIGDLSYTWDANKNKTSETITGVMSGYGFSIPTNGYDAEDRLVGYQRNDNNLNQSWNLSLVGDWNSVTTSGVGFQPATQSRTHGPTHEILTAGSDSITHDAKGNITAKPSNLDSAFTSTLQWDFDNRLMSMDVNEGSTADATFKYDALGRRVQKNSTVYALTGQQVIAKYSAGTAASSPTEQYVFSSYIDEPVLKDGTCGLVYYHRNQQYSILALTNSSGVVERYSYDAYGKLAVKDGSGTAIASSAAGNSITYTGRDFDSETGNYFYRARYYDPDLGRFFSRDPIGYYGSKWSLCEFLSGCSLSKNDPSGNNPVVVVVPIIWACAYPQYLATKIQYGHLSDDFQHCVASCRISKLCGNAMCELIGIAKEAKDLFLPPPFSSSTLDFKDAIKDFVANNTCMPWQSSLPCPVSWWYNGAFGESCANCCWRKGY